MAGFDIAPAVISKDTSLFIQGIIMNSISFKSATLRALVPLALVSGALMGVHGTASALTTESATVCKPYGNSNTAGLYSYVNGVHNYSGASMAVACPIIRTVAAPSGGYSIWVDGSAAAGTASCSIYSYNYTGAYLGSVSFSATGTFDRLITLPAAQAPTYSSQVVYCVLPNNGGLFDVEPVQ